MTIILDYGIGNLNSIKKMIQKSGFESEISNDPLKISQADKLILPGIGSFDHGMSNLINSGFFEILNKKVLIDKIPILGVCLGVQLFTESSEEGKQPGLGWVKGKTIKFISDYLEKDRLKIPHMGWSDVQIKKSSRLFENMFLDPRFYFVHSFHLECNDPKDVLVSAKYGYEFVAGIEKDNIVGVQFHPEKSHKFGMKIFENFIKYY